MTCKKEIKLEMKIIISTNSNRFLIRMKCFKENPTPSAKREPKNSRCNFPYGQIGIYRPVIRQDVMTAQ